MPVWDGASGTLAVAPGVGLEMNWDDMESYEKITEKKRKIPCFYDTSSRGNTTDCSQYEKDKKS